MAKKVAKKVEKNEVNESKVESTSIGPVRLPWFGFIEGVAYWQVPDEEHLKLLKEAAEKNNWELLDQGRVKKTGKKRFRITHNWLRNQYLLEQFARLEEQKENEKEEIRHQEDRAAMNSLPHLIFKGSICDFTPETDQQIRGLELKADRLGWEFEVLPDGIYRICKRPKKVAG